MSSNQEILEAHPSSHRQVPRGGLTLLAPLLLGAVDVVLELDADLPLVGLVPDEGVLEQLLRGGPLGVVLHQAALDEAEKLLRPVGERNKRRFIRSMLECGTPPLIHFVLDRWGQGILGGARACGR